MQIRFLFSFLFFLLLTSSCQVEKDIPNVFELWYSQPASMWEEALPVGNGRLGAMIFGAPTCEHLQFNEETLWDSGPRDYNRKGAWKNLDEIRSLLFDGKQREAERLAAETFMGRVSYEEEFLPLRKAWADSVLNLSLVQSGFKAEFDDSDWDEMMIDFKSVWENNGLPDLNGSVLFRRKVEIPENWKDQQVTFQMGRLKDEDFTYVNGHLVGNTYEENGNRSYTLPAGTFKPGENTIAVLINNYVSTGGFNGVRQPPYKMNLRTTGALSDTIMVEGIWKYKVINDKPPYYPQYQANYQPFGDLKIAFEGHEDYSNYRRSLNLNESLANVTYTVGDVTYQREVLASFPDNAIALKFSSDHQKSISFKATFESVHEKFKVRKIDENSFAMDVEIDNGVMKGTASIQVTSDGGEIKVSDQGVEVLNANKAWIKLVAATNYLSYDDVSGDSKERNKEYLNAVADLSYDSIKVKHQTDYKRYYDRFSLDLGGIEKRLIPTDQRIRNVENEPDNDLAALYVQYARYLMLSSGRSGTKPANLQGIWNDKVFPAWGSKYTLNINNEMNYWPVEPLNISECHNSLFEMIDELSVKGAVTAKEYYNSNGWMVHHNTDQWRGTAPINNSNHGIWVAGGAWLTTHLWEHFLYSQDTSFLRNRAYPLMKGAAEFFVDFLVEDPKTGYLISTPSNSPEIGGLVAGPTMDHQIIRALYSQVIEASRILGVDQEFAAVLKDQKARIAPNTIGRFGQLQEWMEDKDDTTSTHRHVSHLWGVHPGKEINWSETPDLMKAARQSLIYRGDDGTGWSLAWKINFWARFLDGEHAHGMLQMLFSDALNPNRNGGGGSYPNFFDAHPPFQIDGNFGGAAGISEMIVQSHLQVIDLLPAIPKAWSEGEVKGLRVRGGFELDMEWKKGKPLWVKVYSHSGAPLVMRYKDKEIDMATAAGEMYVFEGW